MPNLKSQVEEFLSFLKSCFLDVELLTGLDMGRCFLEVEQRGRHEGIPFLTKTLPNFYKHVLMCVEKGNFLPIVGFRKRRSGPLPLFLGGLVGMLFDSDGCLRKDRQSAGLGYISQLCGLYYKTEIPYTAEQEMEAGKKFLELEESLEEVVYTGPKSADVEKIIDNAIMLARAIFKDFKVDRNPRHGPGAVAGGEKGFDKYNFEHIQSVDDVFPFEEWFFPTSVESYTHSSFPSKVLFKPKNTELWNIFKRSLKRPVLKEYKLRQSRVCFVNKDSRGPRVISCEPKELQWLQQAIGQSIMRWVENHPLTRGAVNFTDQQINADLALESSKNRRFATLDMADASDRVTMALVRGILPTNLVRLLEASRSLSARLRVPKLEVHLKKFAPMGSACCFPVESIIFFILSAATLMFYRDCTPEAAKRRIYVYGDDLIVRTSDARLIVESLERFQLKFNNSKCFVDGPFRESCGVDAIDGILVTPVRLRTLFPKSRKDVSSIISLTETSNLLFYAGFWNAADWARKRVERILKKPLQYVPYQSGCLGVTGFRSGYQIVPGNKKSKHKVRRIGVGISRRYQAVAIHVTRIATPTETDTSEGRLQRLLKVLCKDTPERAWYDVMYPQESQEASSFTNASFMTLRSSVAYLS